MQIDDISCPGQNTMFWKPDDIYDVKCPNCGAPVEFWKDDSKRTCGCGHRFLNPKRDLGCLEYCKYAEQCMPEMFEGENLKALYRDRLLAAAKITLKTEDSRLERSLEVVELVEEMLEGEGGEPKVAIAAAILGDLLSAQQPVDQSNSSSQRKSHNATIKKILANLGTESEVVDQVCQIIEHRINGTSSQDISFRSVSDALDLANILEKRSLLDKPALERLIERKLQTETGQRIGRERLLASEER